MATNTSLEARLVAAEVAIVELQKQARKQPMATESANWLQQITGSFKDNPAFDEVLAYGRAFRQGDESILNLQDAS
jgi:hypothetical protein